eukprot:XP_800574.1 PREDICTED: uncharacterized protein LOC589921 isoform X1 [Strongylocentrotus purpuratus]
MRQNLAILLVLAVVGAAFVDAGKADFERRRMEQSKKIRGGMERLKSIDNGFLGGRMDFETVKAEAEQARRAGMANFRGKVNKLQNPHADQMDKLRTKMAADQAKLGSKTNFRNDRYMKSNMKKAFKRQP